MNIGTAGRSCLIIALCLIPICMVAQKQEWPPSKDHWTLRLWPNGPPGPKTGNGPEADTTTAKDGLVAGRPVVRLGTVTDPTITLYKPKGKSTRSAVVVIPGGAYRILAIDLEGTEVCDWLTSQGITCVLLKYRVPDSGPYPKSPAALQDAQRAVGIVRSHAVDWHLDYHKIGVLGFSAGAHLAAVLGTNFNNRLYDLVDSADQLSCRPDFTALVYPAYLTDENQNFAPSPETNPTAQAPPTFIVQTEDDPIHVENALVYFRELKDAKVPAELHIYAQGGHGYGLRRTELPVTEWPRLVETWFRGNGILPPQR
jgi:acetyl esterase/lipase